MRIDVIGAGFAGVETACHLSGLGHRVRLFEKRSKGSSPGEVHSTDDFAEPVCSNSFKSTKEGTPAWGLKEEMRMMGSVILECADRAKVGAGDALAVDRRKFSAIVTQYVTSHENIEVIREEISAPKEDVPTILAVGPLPGEQIADFISEKTMAAGGKGLHFFDAIAPIVEADTLDYDLVFRGSRRARGDDYLNCPLDRDEYETLVADLCSAEIVVPRTIAEKREQWRFFEGCTPVEVIASSGVDSLRHAQLSPKGFEMYENGRDAHAIIQLRAENTEGSAYSLVGFQTRMKYQEQKRVLGRIKALRNAVFLRLGSVHRNSYIDSPTVLDDCLRLKGTENIYFSGQITGVEGYMESASNGLLVGHMLGDILKGDAPRIPPADTFTGSLYRHLRRQTDAFQPSAANFGLIDYKSFAVDRKRYRKKWERRSEAAKIAVQNFSKWWGERK